MNREERSPSKPDELVDRQSTAGGLINLTKNITTTFDNYENSHSQL